MERPHFRKCVQCGKKKILTEFHKNKWSKQGRVATCKVCQHERQRVRNAKDPAYINNQLLREWER